MKYNIIFLDVDGVLNSEHPMEGDFSFYEIHMGSGELNRFCILRLKRILDNVENSKIVLSSSWRTDSWRVNKLKQFLSNYGIEQNRFIDITPRIGTRTKDIQTWLDDNKDIVERYVAIDDFLLDLDNSVRTEARIGMTDDNVDKCIRILTE